MPLCAYFGAPVGAVVLPSPPCAVPLVPKPPEPVPGVPFDVPLPPMVPEPMFPEPVCADPGVPLPVEPVPMELLPGLPVLPVAPLAPPVWALAVTTAKVEAASATISKRECIDLSFDATGTGTRYARLPASGQHSRGGSCGSSYWRHGPGMGPLRHATSI